MNVDTAVIDAVAGWPGVGEWDTMIQLLTVDANGFPHVCLLSRAELDASADQVFAVIASPTTMCNLQRSRRATLVTVGDSAAQYTKLIVNQILTENDWLAVVFDVASTKQDGVGVRLSPPRYLVTESIGVQEQWHRSKRLLAHLKGITQ